MTKDEKVIRQKEKRDLSREAMRELYGFARSHVNNRIEGELPSNKILDAKEYFQEWKRRKPFGKNGFIFFVVASIIIFSFFPSTLWGMVFFLFVLLVVEGIYLLLESEKSKKSYVHEMLGDLSHLKEDERSVYLKGLVFELWRIDEIHDYKTVGIVNVVLIAGVIFGYFSGNENSAKAISILSVFAIASIDFIKEIRS